MTSNHDGGDDRRDLADVPEEHLAGLEARFMEGLERVRQGRHQDAMKIFREILGVEPRLPEPRLELARVLLDVGRLEDAEAEAREALLRLESGGQWTEELPENVVKGLAEGLLAEILRQRADSDEVVFGDPRRFKALAREARARFARAAQLDPENQHAHYHAFFMGLDEQGKPVDDEDEGPTEPSSEA